MPRMASDGGRVLRSESVRPGLLAAFVDIFTTLIDRTSFTSKVAERRGRTPKEMEKNKGEKGPSY